jgi:3-oxoacyl-[acyl-carrier-protein] synthase II
MRAPLNRRVHVVGYGAATPLGKTFDLTFERAVKGEAGFRRITRCQVTSRSNVVGEIPDWDPLATGLFDAKEAHNWNAAFVLLTVTVCREALDRSGIVMDASLSGRTACLIGSALNGTDAFRIAMDNYVNRGPYKVSPYLLPNLCGNMAASKAGIHLGLTGPLFSPQGACASGNHAIGIGARMIRDGDADLVLAGGVDTSLVPEIVQGFANMNATIKVNPEDRAFGDPGQASRPFSVDRRGMVLSEGCGVVVLAADDFTAAHGLEPRAEILGVGWTSDAFHFSSPRADTIVLAMNQAIEDAGIGPGDVQYVNAHGTSTVKGDRTEVECLRRVFGKDLVRIPVSSNKSQIGHTLGASAAIEAALGIEAMNRELVLPTINYRHDPEFDDVDFVPDVCRAHRHGLFLSNAFGFGGTNCCIVFRGV